MRTGTGAYRQHIRTNASFTRTLPPAPHGNLASRRTYRLTKQAIFHGSTTLESVTTFTMSDDLALARAAAANADLISLSRFRAQDLVVTTKPDRTPVTDADVAVEDTITSTILASRPHDAILGEERGSSTKNTGQQPGRQWIIDPIDGTVNFLRGVPIWATLIALAIDGNPVVSVQCSRSGPTLVGGHRSRSLDKEDRPHRSNATGRELSDVARGCHRQLQLSPRMD